MIKKKENYEKYKNLLMIIIYVKQYINALDYLNEGVKNEDKQLFKENTRFYKKFWLDDI